MQISAVTASRNMHIMTLFKYLFQANLALLQWIGSGLYDYFFQGLSNTLTFDMVKDSE